MKKIILLSLLSLIQAGLFAQEIKVVRDKKPSKSNALNEEKKHPVSIQFHAGTQGIGIDARYGITQQLSFRLGGSAILPIKINNALKFSDFNSTNNLRADLANAHLLADYAPFKKWQGFRLVGGTGYLFKGNGRLNVIPKGDFKYGDIRLTPEQLGVVDFNISWRGIAPYVGVGFLKSFPKKAFNVNIDLGTYYLTAPKATIVGTEMLAHNDSQSDLITSNVSDYRWLPVIQLNFNFKIK